MIIRSSQEMMALGKKLAAKLCAPAVVELVGDVGVGKTTFTQGLAKELGVVEEVNSPSFTISKRYALPDGGELVHYDFYRLNDVGIMRDELAETLAQKDSIVVIEWGAEVADLLTQNIIKVQFTMREDGSRVIDIVGMEIGE